MTKLYAALSVVITIVGFAAAAPIETYTIGNWVVRANTDDRTGQFSACIATVNYKSGIDLHVVVSRHNVWALGFSSQSWKFVPGAKATVEYRFDNSPRWAASVVDVLSPTLVNMAMPVHGSVVDLFRRSRIMELRYQQQSFFFNLDGTSRLMISLADCVQRHVTYSAPVAAQNTAPPPNEKASAELKLEGTRVLSNFLIAAGIQNAALVDEAQFPEQLFFAHAVAVSKDVIGFALVLPNPDGTEDNVAAQIGASVSERCDGKVGTGSSKEERGGIRIINGFTACQTKGNDVLLQYVVMARQPAGQYVFGVLSESSSAPKQPAQAQSQITSERILDAAFQMSK